MIKNHSFQLIQQLPHHFLHEEVPSLPYSRVQPSTGNPASVHKIELCRPRSRRCRTRQDVSRLPGGARASPSSCRWPRCRPSPTSPTWIGTLAPRSSRQGWGFPWSVKSSKQGSNLNIKLRKKFHLSVIFCPRSPPTSSWRTASFLPKHCTCQKERSWKRKEKLQLQLSKREK